jgi:hypothetical protein
VSRLGVSLADGVADEVCAGLEIEFAQDAFLVAVDGLGAAREFLGDLDAGEALADEADDLDLAGREFAGACRERVIAGWRCWRRG